MKKLLLPLFLIFLFSCQAESEEIPSVIEVESGRVVRLDSFPSKYISARNVDVWLPEGYTSTGSYQVLYMHDGQALFDSTINWNNQEWGVDETMGRLIAEKEIAPTIVVGIWNGRTSRHADYFPQKAFEMLSEAYQDSLMANAESTNGYFRFSEDIRSDNYLKFLTQELKPYIDKYYPTKADKAHTFIAGSSMGGLISAYAICEYPELFGAAACLSTHWPGVKPHEDNPVPASFQSYLAEALPDPSTHKIYFDYGTETLDAHYEPHQLKVDSIMRAKGYDSSNWITNKYPGANHSERAWMKRLAEPLLFLMKK